jgi:hypothetical protein
MEKWARFIIQDLKVNILVDSKCISVRRNGTEVCPLEIESITDFKMKWAFLIE